eukprot:767309-Hanusia_phi.AAC.8
MSRQRTLHRISCANAFTSSAQDVPCLSTADMFAPLATNFSAAYLQDSVQTPTWLTRELGPLTLHQRKVQWSPPKVVLPGHVAPNVELTFVLPPTARQQQQEYQTFHGVGMSSLRSEVQRRTSLHVSC